MLFSTKFRFVLLSILIFLSIAFLLSSCTTSLSLKINDEVLGQNGKKIDYGRSWKLEKVDPIMVSSIENYYGYKIEDYGFLIHHIACNILYTHTGEVYIFNDDDGSGQYHMLMLITTCWRFNEKNSQEKNQKLVITKKFNELGSQYGHQVKFTESYIGAGDSTLTFIFKFRFKKDEITQDFCTTYQSLYMNYFDECMKVVTENKLGQIRVYDEKRKDNDTKQDMDIPRVNWK